MGIGKRIKEARNARGLTQEQLAHMLGVTKGAVANYENETSHPKEPIMYKMFDALKVDANYLFQDVAGLPNKDNDVTLSEYNLIKRYRKLDSRGKAIIDAILRLEYDYCNASDSDRNADVEAAEISRDFANMRALSGD